MMKYGRVKFKASKLSKKYKPSTSGTREAQARARGDFTEASEIFLIDKIRATNPSYQKIIQYMSEDEKSIYDSALRENYRDKYGH